VCKTATCFDLGYVIPKFTTIANNTYSRIKLYNTLALPVLLYGSETWTVKARVSRRITAAEMKYMTRTAG
jgi:hypothetical protein